MNSSKHNKKVDLNSFQQQYSNSKAYAYGQPELPIQPKVIKPKTISQTTTTTTRRYIVNNPSILTSVLPPQSGSYRVVTNNSNNLRSSRHPTHFPNIPSFKHSDFDYELMGNINPHFSNARIRSSSLNRKPAKPQQQPIINIINYPLTECEIKELSKIKTSNKQVKNNLDINKIEESLLDQVKSPIKTTPTIPISIPVTTNDTPEKKNKVV